MPSDATVFDGPVVRVTGVIVLGLALVVQVLHTHRAPQAGNQEIINSGALLAFHESISGAPSSAQPLRTSHDQALLAKLPVAGGRVAGPGGNGDRRRLALSPAPAASSALSWAQAVGGTSDDHAQNTAVRPPARYMHVAAAVPTVVASTVTPGNVLLFGGGGDGARADTWLWQQQAVTEKGTTSKVVADSSGSRACGGDCGAWTSFAALDGETGIPVSTCFGTEEEEGGLAPLATVSTLVSPTDVAYSNNCTIANLGRFQTSSALLYNAESSNVTATARLLAFSGRRNEAYDADVVELVYDSKRWFTVASNSSWLQDPSASESSSVFPAQRSGAASTAVQTPSTAVSSAAFATGTSAWSESLGVTPTADDKTHVEAVLPQLAVGETKILASSVRSLSLTSLTYTATPITWTRMETGKFRARIVSTASTTETVAPSGTNRVGSLATQTRLQNATQAVELVYTATTVGTTVVQIDNLDVRIFNVSIDAVASSTPTAGKTSLMVMGGWDGSQMLADVWRLDAALQPTSDQWSPDTLLGLTVDRQPVTGVSASNTSLFSDWPAIPTRLAWSQVATTGGSPLARMGHSLTVVGSPGGVGKDRWAAIMFGGRGTYRDLADVWTLSLEPWNEQAPAPADGVQTIQCRHAAGTALQLSHAGTTTTVALTGASTLSDLQTAVTTLFGARVHSVSVQTRVATAGPSSTTALSSFHTSTMCDQQAATVATATVIEITLRHPRSGGGGSAFEALTLSGGGAGDQVLGVVNTSVPATHGEYVWTQVNATMEGPVARAWHAAVAITDPDDTTREAVFFHGGLTSVGLRRDAWLFTLDSTPAGGAWREVGMLQGGAHWITCVQTLIQWLMGGTFSCQDTSSSLLPARYGHQMTKVAASIDESGATPSTDAVFMSGGVDERRLARGDNTVTFGQFDGASSPDALVLCFDPALCGKPIIPT